MAETADGGTATAPQADATPELRLDELTPGLAKRRSWLLVGVLLTGISNVATAIYSGALWVFLDRIETGAFDSQEDIEQAGLAIDMLGGVAGIGLIISMLLSVVAYSYWTHRAARIAHILAPNEMTISPNWAVAWNFIPIASLWMPFRAMGQIWRASFSADALGASVVIPGVFWVWWLCWVASNLLANVSLRIGGFEPSFDELKMLAPFDLLSSVLLVVSCIALAPIIRRVTERQISASEPGVFD